MSHSVAAHAIDDNGSFWKSRPGYKPILLLIALSVFVFLVVIPPPQSMLDLVNKENPPGAALQKGTKTLVESVNKKLRPDDAPAHGGEHKEVVKLTEKEVAQVGKVTLAIFGLVVFLWATETLPLGATDILVAVMLYLFGILPLEEISKSYMQDAVFFIFGILAVAVGVSKTGLDKRIGLLLLSRIKSAKAFAFIFFPAIAMSASFLSEHALVALLIPVLLGVYKVSCKMYGFDKDRALGVFLLLGLCLAANHGGPGSPAAGGRNAIMVGYLTGAGYPISFLEWMKYGFPFVPVMGFIIGLFMYMVVKPKFKVQGINPSEVVRLEVAKMPKFGGREAIMAVILVILVACWIILGEEFGLGGPTLYAVMAMFLTKILTWDDIQDGVAFDVVGLYAAACAMGVALKFSGGALWMAQVFVDVLPDFLVKGDNLTLGVSLATGTMTNFMSDGATVASLGPIFLPMSELTGVHVWKIGLACAFSSSFANAMIVGTPNNAIAFAMGRDPETGERLLTVMDFLKYGGAITILAWLVLWFWTIFGYWRWMSWPTLG
ncbi:Di-/tricarboxylate transporter [uncultured Desulfobacterium sp.]|uniref:Di-/tricarboxylate transporter n=1 Tax=uncultured Desulfobacterium sp. TaxID=201089 RepID=A0A445MYD9_9BACT|nr:Di-/tricarboxylate transporter [uncultured Desulfobacterium sp.]